MGWYGPQGGNCSCCDGGARGECCENFTPTQAIYTISGSSRCGGAVNGTYVFDILNCQLDQGDGTSAAYRYLAVSGGACGPNTELAFFLNLAPANIGIRLEFDLDTTDGTPPEILCQATTEFVCDADAICSNVLGETFSLSLS